MTFNYRSEQALNKTNILKYVTDYDLLKYYVPEFKGYGKPIISNLRDDDKSSPSLHFMVKSNQRAIISDFGYKKGMDIWEYLAILLGYNISGVGFMSLLETIRINFNIPLRPYSSYIKPSRKKTRKSPIVHGKTFLASQGWDIRCRYRKWNSTFDKDYWFCRYGISANTLNLWNVKPIEYFQLMQGEKKITYIASEKTPRYAYVPHPKLNITGWKKKIYSPTLKGKGKWYNSLTQDIVLGLHTLPQSGRVLILETSVKDAMTNYTLFKENEEIYFLDIFSESVLPPKAIIDDLRCRFDYIFYHADSDEPGLRMAIEHFKTNDWLDGWFCNPLQSGLKDSSDMRFVLGEDVCRKFIEEQVVMLIKLTDGKF